jgi:hypothetical protein
VLKSVGILCILFLQFFEVRHNCFDLTVHLPEHGKGFLGYALKHLVDLVLKFGDHFASHFALLGKNEIVLAEFHETILGSRHGLRQFLIAALCLFHGIEQLLLEALKRLD